jgi:YVTN family beta-propeller protein
VGTGHPVRTIAVGVRPVALAVDERTQHAFVVNGNVGDSLYPLGAGSVTVLDMHGEGRVLRTVAVGEKPVTIAVDERTQRALVVNAVSPWPTMPGSVSLLDTRSGTVVRTVAIGINPGPIAVDVPSGHVFVANMDDDSVSLLDARSGTVLRTLSVGARPAAIAVDPKTRRVFVVNSADNSVSVLDTQRGTVLRTIATSADPTAVAVDESAGRVFVAAANGFGRLHNAPGKVDILDASSGALLRTISVGAGSWAIAVDQRDQEVFVANGSDTGIDPNGTVSVLAARSGTVLRTVPAANGPIALSSPLVSAGSSTTSQAFVPNGSGNPLAADEASGRAFVVGTVYDGSRSSVNLLHVLQALLLRLNPFGTPGSRRGSPPGPPAGTGVVSILETGR